VKAGTTAPEFNEMYLQIGFTLPVEPKPTAEYVTGSSSASCPGVVAGVPTAEPGFLCVYKNLAGTGEFLGFLDPSGAPNQAQLGTSPSGTVLGVLCKSPSCTWQGTWAVTAG
jgi:hypothetical protein